MKFHALFVPRLGSIRILCLCAALLGVSAVAPMQAAWAESVTVSVDLPIIGEPRSVTGIALGPTLEMIKSVSLKRFSAGALTATFNVPDKSTAVLAMAEMEDGSTIFGDTRLVSTAQTTPSLASIPECSVAGVIKADPSQRGLMESLVEIRTARRDVIKNRINTILSGATLEKARKLEELFGLARSEPLTAELPPTQIIDRVSRLTAAIKSYRLNRAARRAEGAQTPAQPATARGSGR